MARMRSAGQWAVVAAGKALAMVMGVAFLSFMAFAIPFAAALSVVQAAHWTRWAPVEIAALAVLVAATLAAAWWSCTGERVHRWLDSGRAEAVLPSIATLGLAIGTFASLTQSLYDGDLLELQGEGISSDTIVDMAFEFYVWHLLDAVPLLDIPLTLRWEEPYTYTDSLSGAVLLVFKGFVILPLIQVARLILIGGRRRPASPVAD